MVHLFYLSLLIIPDICYQLWCFTVIICLLAAISDFLILVNFLINASLLSSDVVVRFGPVQRTLCLNLGPDLWFGSSRLLNLGLDLEGLVRQVWFG